MRRLVPIEAAYGKGWSWRVHPREHHEELLEAVKAQNGGVVPDYFIQSDLVHLADEAAFRNRRMPSRRMLMARWGVTDGVARQHLRSMAWQEVATELNGTLPKRHPASNARRPITLPTPPSATDDVRGPAECVIERADPVEIKSPSPVQRRTPRHAFQRQHESLDEVLTFWNDTIVQMVVQDGYPRPPRHRTEPVTGLGRRLNRRLHQSGRDATLAVMRWFACSGHPRAEFLRIDNHGLPTLIRESRFDDYLQFALAERTPLGGV